MINVICSVNQSQIYIRGNISYNHLIVTNDRKISKIQEILRKQQSRFSHDYFASISNIFIVYRYISHIFSGNFII
jgi:hypothetical protein